MTDDQKTVFIQAAQMGMACGLEHPWEWFYNAQRALLIAPWDTLSMGQARLNDAFLAFWHGCGAFPDDPCETATIEDLYAEIERWYGATRDSSMNQEGV